MAPLSRFIGATPTRAAICLRSNAPSSGKCARSTKEICSPTPGIDRSRSSCSRQTGLRRSVSRSSLSKSSISISSQSMCSCMRGLTAPVARPRRFFSATNVVINWLRRTVNALSS